MGKFSTGPDAIDLIAMMNAMNAVHQGEVAIVLSLPGPGFSTGLKTTCQATFTVLPGSDLPKTVAVQGNWPCKDHPTLEGHLFDGLYRLDAAIQRAYEQMEIPEA